MLDIVQVIESYEVKLAKVGDNLYRGFCPFHNDIGTPNLTVYPITQSYFCFGCNSGGDVYDFIASVENISKRDAIVIYGDVSLESVLSTLDEKPEVDFSLSLNMLLSNKCRRFLEKKPEKLVNVVSIMKEFDKRLGLFISQEESFKITEEFEKKLEEV